MRSTMFGVGRSLRRQPGFMLAELLVFSLLVAIVFVGVVEVAGLVAKGSRSLDERRREVLAFSSMLAEARGGAIEGEKRVGRSAVIVTSASGFGGAFYIEAVFGDGTAAKMGISWRSRGVLGRR